jgi:hypothetical protein
MVNERPDYRALRTIPDRNMPSRTGVEDWGLVVGEDVTPARPDVIARPSGNATRTEWAVYALGQGLTPAEVDDMSRDQIRERFPADEPEPAGAAEPIGDLGDDVPDGTVEEVLAWVNEDPEQAEARAVMVLAAERGRQRPRSGVVEPLEKMLNTGDE